jgi:uncharacterized protein DUF4135
VPPYNLCPRRRRLYEPYLDATATFLANLTDANAKGVFASDATTLKAALADGELVEALEEILIPFVLYGVCRDLARLRKSDALFRVDKKGNPPPLWMVLPTGGISPDDLPGYTQESGVSPETGYIRYFERYINPPNVAAEGTKPRSGIDAFYARYPLLAYAVQTLTSHYQKNIQLACERVLRDRADIGKAFFGERTIQSLKKIKTTGNDFHKGGKQVLILTVTLDDGSEGKVVYKPSAIEIDCRLVGDSSVFTNEDLSRRVLPKGPEDLTGFSQDASLTELINGFIHMPEPLPTYRILPYNRGSVPEAYGYIEFLTHLPSVEAKCRHDDIAPLVGEEIKNMDSSAVKNSDWITGEDTSDALVFFHQLGGLMAMATAVSLCDLHVQNMIVHRRRPHLIDLEEALKEPMTSISQTYMVGKNESLLYTYYDPEAPVPEVTAEQKAGLTLNGSWRAQYKHAATSALYLYPVAGKPAVPARINSDDRRFTPADAETRRRDRKLSELNRRALIMGLTDVLGALADNVDEVKTWVRGLDKTLARYVTLGTAQYARAGRELYAFNCETDVASLSRDGAPRASDGWYDKVKEDGEPKALFFRKQFNERLTTWLGRQKPGAWNPAFFALEHPDHVWRDYLNCDVPCFYHELGSPDLLNSKGDKVDVNEALAWQVANLTRSVAVPGAWKPNAGGAYLDRKPTEMICDQLDALAEKWANPLGRRTVMAQMVAGEASLEGEVASMFPHIQVPVTSGR